MSAFEYAALDQRGRVRRGVLEGDTAKHIRQKLREQGLIPLDIAELVRTSEQRHPRRIYINATDLALFTRQLATLIQSGLALAEALRAMAEQTEKSRLKNIIVAVRARVLEGHNLADSLSEFPSVFPELYQAMVAAGEQSGYLDLVLDRLADYTENRQYIRQKTMLALFYPTLLTIMALLIVIGLLTYVVPQVVQVFHHLNQTLPGLTRGLIALSQFLQQWGFWLLGGFIAFILGIRYLLRFEHFLIAYHRLRLQLPFLARLERSNQVARFTRTLSILLESGVPLLEALHIAAQVLSNRLFRQAVTQATHQVREGSSLHHALGQTGLFPPMILHLIASGETSGQIEKMLERGAVMQERELETLIGVLLSLFEPLLILIMGSLVLVIVLAILMPIFELNQLVR